jgi:hypothetical protein
VVAAGLIGWLPIAVWDEVWTVVMAADPACEQGKQQEPAKVGNTLLATAAQRDDGVVLRSARDRSGLARSQMKVSSTAPLTMAIVLRAPWRPQGRFNRRNR